MGWFNTMLNVATAASSAYSAAQLHSLRRQNAEAAVIQALLAHLRNRIFELRQMAESALSLEAESPKVAAGALSVVEMHLKDSGITPDMFPELVDKEYAAQTWRLVAHNMRRLMGQLTSAEQAEEQQFVAVARRLPDYNYYLEHYEDGRRLAEASETVARYAGRNGCLARMALLTYIVVGLPFLGWTFGGSGGNGFSNAGFLFGLVLGVVGLIFWLRQMHVWKYGEAKRTVDELGKKMDVDRFKALDQELGDATRARQLQAHAQALADAFFENRPLPPPPTLTPAALPDSTAAGSAGPSRADATVTSVAGKAPGPNAPDRAAPAVVPPLQVHVQRRTEGVRTNARVVQGPPADNGEPQWVVRSKDQDSDLSRPLGRFHCPECGRLYYVALQPAHLELFCLACGQGITVKVE
jgi:hypothetical protein